MTGSAFSESLSGVPLHALTAVVLDTETTGLDTRADRIIEIGAVRLSCGRLIEEDHFSELIDPGLPIPAAASGIHGIGNTDVVGQPTFSEIWRRFSDWSETSLVIGYSIGFDVAILAAEHKRRGLDWRAPRTLDVRHLIQWLSPNLPDEALETVAAWLGIEVSGRHRALGDASLTARIFLALLPKLQDRGVLTLAQAERVCRSLVTRREEEARAGWHVSSKGDALTEYARVDSFPYRHRSADVMHTPPVIVEATTPLRSALSLMARENVGSVFVRADEEGSSILGIMTERDVVRAIDSHDADALAMPASAFASCPLITVGDEEFIYRALVMMASHQIRHLGVTDADGNVIGAMSARDLLRQRASDAISLGDSIETAANAEELGRIWRDLTTVAGALVREDVDSRDIAAIISRELRALTRRAAEIAEAELIATGQGSAPTPYALLVLGSGGRGESLLAMDQDNAIIFEEGEPDGEADRWFASLGKRVADILDQSGVCYCKGGIMGANPEWRMSRSRWHDLVRGWMQRSRPEDILNCDIFFDALSVHGDRNMAEVLRNDAITAARTEKLFLKALSINAGNFSTPVGLFGRFKLTNGRVDLKLGGILPIFSAARVVSLEHGIQARSTPDRLRAFGQLDIISTDTIDGLIEAHRILLDLILRQQLRDISDGLSLSNKIAPNQLSESDRGRLHWALEQVSNVPDLLGTPAIG